MTYPNVLVMGYLKETGSLTPEWRMKCEAAINAGYQRLLTFEVKGGGFDWYGAAPAKTILTAYGILELNDMDKVYPIDRRVIDRAKAILDQRQKSDGSWTVDIPMHTWQQLANSSLPITAYVIWALKEAGYKDEVVRRGEAWLQVNQDQKADPYVRALVALALGDRGSIAALEAAAQVKGDEVWVPVAVYNYLKEPQTIALSLETEKGIEVVGEREKKIDLRPDDVTAVRFHLRAADFGRFALTVKAIGTKFSDAQRRSIDVLPDGKEFPVSASNRVVGRARTTVTIPAEAIPGASRLWVRLYPSTFSEVVKGLEGLVRMPYG